MTTTVENQTQFIVPTNQETQTIDYNMRLLISDNQTNPIAWEVSKREDTFPVGLTKITLKQALFNPNTDNRKLMIADYYKSKVLDENPNNETKYQISYAGKPQVKVGGYYKTYHIPDIDHCSWKIEGINSDKYEIISPFNSNQIKIKVAKDYNLVGTVFQLSAYSNEKLLDKIDVEVISI